MKLEKDNDELRLNWKDYLALTLAMFETIFLPFLVPIALLVIGLLLLLSV